MVGFSSLTEIFLNKHYRGISNAFFSLSKFPPECHKCDGKAMTKSEATTLYNKGVRDVLAIEVDNVHPDNSEQVQTLLVRFEQHFDLKPGQYYSVFSGGGVHLYIPTKDSLSLPDYEEVKRAFFKQTYLSVCRSLGVKKGNQDPWGLSPWLAMGRIPDSVNEKKSGGTLTTRPVIPLASDRGEGIPPAHTFEDLLKLLGGKTVFGSGLSIKNYLVKTRLEAKLEPKESKTVQTPLAGCKFVEAVTRGPSEFKEPEHFDFFRVLRGESSSSEIIRRTVGTIGKYERNDLRTKIERARSLPHISCKAIHEHSPKICESCPHWGEIHAPYDLLIGDKWEGAIKNQFRKVSNKGIVNRDKVDVVKIVRFLIDKHGDELAKVTAGGVYRFQKNVWIELDLKSNFVEFVFDYTGPLENAKKTMEDIFINLRTLLHHLPPHVFKMGGERIYFKDKILNMETLEETDHGPEESVYHVLPHTIGEYRANRLKGEMFLKYMKDFTNEQEVKNRVLQEYAGYVLAGKVPHGRGKALVLEGPPNTGKSEFLKILIHLVGGEERANSVAFSVTQFDEQTAATFAGKLLAFDDDAGSGASKFMKNDGLVKKIITGGVVTTKKLWKDRVDKKIHAKMVILTNDVLVSLDKSGGFWRRFTGVVLTRVKYDDDPGVIFDLGDQIGRKEWAFVLDWAMAGWRRLVKNNMGFTKDPEWEEDLMEMRVESDPLFDFCRNRIEIDNELRSAWRVSSQELFMACKSYCSLKGRWASYSQSKVTRIVAQYIQDKVRWRMSKAEFKIAYGPKDIRFQGKTLNGFLNVRLKNE